MHQLPMVRLGNGTVSDADRPRGLSRTRHIVEDASSTMSTAGMMVEAPRIPDNPAEGYYEWQKTEDGKKIPNYLFSEKEPLLGFAGLYEFWPDPALPEDDPERWLLTCTVLTTVTQDALGHVHDRSPVIIPQDRFAEWLDPDLTDKADVQHLLDSLPEPTLTPRIVSTRVNSVRNNGPELIEAAE